MRDFPFSQRVFNNGYGVIYTIFQYFALSGCILVTVILVGMLFICPTILQKCHLWVLFVLGGLYVISLIAFIVVTVQKNQCKQFIQSDRIYFRKGSVFVYEHAESLDQDDPDASIAYYIYTISHADQIKVLCRTCVITGDIRKRIRYNGRTFGRKKLDVVVIPNAFADVSVLYSAILFQST